jgi:putative DNA methylase
LTDERIPSFGRGTKTPSTYRTKLIEVALPLEAINVASAREKSIRHGHPSTLHLWWARRPLATCRAVLFAQMVDDPSAVPEEFPTEEAQEAERQRLFRIIEKLVQWEATNDESVLEPARREIARSVARAAGVPAPETQEEVQGVLEGHAPPVLDPFCGGGSIPLEAQRLGLEAHASDLNPVAVLITKAMIEIPPKFAGRSPANPTDRGRLGGSNDSWPRAAGLAADVRHYGGWMRDEAFKRIGHLYPEIRLPPEQGGREATVIAWLWARTVTCPNPACSARMPLVRSFWLCTKRGKETWVEPDVDRKVEGAPRISFTVHRGAATAEESRLVGSGSGFVNDRGKKVQATFLCVACKSGIAKGDYIDHEADQGRMGRMPLAVVAEGDRGRLYLPFDAADQAEADARAEALVKELARSDRLPTQQARGTFASNAQGRIYGFKTFADYFAPRQLVALTTFTDLVVEARERVLADARGGRSDHGGTLGSGDLSATTYADAVATYLGLAVDRLVDRNSSICSWDTGYVKIRNTFARQAIPMTWDYAEANPFSDSTGNFVGAVEWVAEVVSALPTGRSGVVWQADASKSLDISARPLISTDPPYYGNIGYADLSDFFYVWLRRALRTFLPDLFSTVLVPKAQELVATPHRFAGGAREAKQFFEEGLHESFAGMREKSDGAYPLTVYYAFKQTETETGAEHGQAIATSTGWETMLSGLLRAGFSITGTWPVRSELTNRIIASGTNALASSIVLVCRPRTVTASLATRREFVTA